MTTELLDRTLACNLAIARDEAMKMIKAQIQKGVALGELRIRSAAELEKARGLRADWTQFTSALLTQMFDTNEAAELFNRWTGKILPEYAGLSQFIEHFHDEVVQRLNRLVEIRQYIQDASEVVRARRGEDASSGSISGPELSSKRADEMLLMDPPSTPVSVASAKQPSQPVASGAALIVHARNEAVESSLRSFVQMLGYDLTLVADEGDGTRGLVTRLAQQAISFAVLLPTPDDVASLRRSDNDTVSASCQRWTFELGYCVGRLGAARVVILHSGNEPLAYDDHGVLYIPVDPAEGWQLQLARQLKRSGIDIDLNRLC